MGNELPCAAIDIGILSIALRDGVDITLIIDADGDRLAGLPWVPGGGNASCVVRALPEDERTSATAGELRELIHAHNAEARAAAAAADASAFCLVVRLQRASGTAEERFVKRNEARRLGCELAVHGETEYVAWMFGRDAERSRLPVQLVVTDALSDRDPGYRAGLAEKRLLIVGLGSFGATVAADLARAGVRHFTLADGERLESGNVVRHVAGLSDVGRRKTRIARRIVRDFAPDATVDLIEVMLSAGTKDLYERAMAAADLIVCTTDSRQSRMTANRLARQAGVTAIFGGVSRGAYSGMVLRARADDPCYNCFAIQFPAAAADRETNESAYAATPDAHLALDIWPVVNLISRIALLELSVGAAPTTLNEDLTAPWYIWVNRREKEYEQFVALGRGTETPSALRWIPVDAPKAAGCSACEGAGRARSALVRPQALVDPSKLKP